MRRGAHAALLLLAFTPALASALLVAENAVDVPVADDWARAALLEPGRTVADFSVRGAFPRLAARANARWFGGDLTLEMAGALGVVLLTALCVYGLLRRSVPGPPAARYGGVFVANLLLFSPIQWERFLWAAHAWSLVPFAALCAGLLVAGSRWPTPWKVTAGALLAGLAAACVAPGALLAAPGAGLGPASLLGVLGSPFARTSLLPAEALAPWAGAAVAGLFVVSAGVCFVGRRDPQLRSGATAWLVLGGVALASGALAARTAADAQDALASCRASAGLHLCLAAFALLVLGAAALRRRLPRAGPALRTLLEGAPAFVGGILTVAAALSWLVGMQGMREWKSARLQARTSLIFLERFEPVQPERLAGAARVEEVRRAARTLDRHGQLRPGLAGGAGIDPFSVGRPLAREWGDLESVWTSAEVLDLTGFAWLPGAERPADGVLVTARVAGEPRRLVGVAELQAMPLPPIPEHDHIYNHARLPGLDERAPWRLRIPAEALPEAPKIQVEAFAADSERLLLHRLAHQVVVRRSDAGLRAEPAPGGAP